MSKRIVLAVGLIALLSSAGVAVLSAFGQVAVQPAPAQPAGTFAGKTICVESKNAGWTSLEQIEVKTVAGRSFIVGQQADDSDFTRNTFPPGTTHWVPLDEVTQLIEKAVKAK